MHYCALYALHALYPLYALVIISPPGYAKDLGQHEAPLPVLHGELVGPHLARVHDGGLTARSLQHVRLQQAGQRVLDSPQKVSRRAYISLSKISFNYIAICNFIISLSIISL